MIAEFYIKYTHCKLFGRVGNGREIVLSITILQKNTEYNNGKDVISFQDL